MYDVVFLGSGHSCWHGAITLALAGKKVAIVDGDLPGGTCTNYGCDARVILDDPFEFVEGLERCQDLCVWGNGKINWKSLMAYKRRVLEPFPGSLLTMFEKAGIEFVPVFGKIVDAHTVRAGDTMLETENIVIGTGQRDSVLDIPGKEFLHNSRKFIDIDEMPEHLICIGAGIIGVEFASMALILGKKVTFVEFASRALATYPEAYVANLVAAPPAAGPPMMVPPLVARSLTIHLRTPRSSVTSAPMAQSPSGSTEMGNASPWETCPRKRCVRRRYPSPSSSLLLRQVGPRNAKRSSTGRNESISKYTHRSPTQDPDALNAIRTRYGPDVMHVLHRCKLSQHGPPSTV